VIVLSISRRELAFITAFCLSAVISSFLIGCRGQTGQQGRQGEQGIPGKDGRDGKDGLSIKGEPGPRGFAGRPGQDGLTKSEIEAIVDARMRACWTVAPKKK
jgi:collagen triple helix repeat protein